MSKKARKAMESEDPKDYEVTEFGRRRKRGMVCGALVRVLGMLAVPFVFLYHHFHPHKLG